MPQNYLMIYSRSNMEYIIITVLSLTSIALGYGCWNILKKYEKLEDNYEAMGSWFVSFRKGVIGMDNKMKEIDNKGHFRSDDEVGFFFKELKKMQGMLNEYFDYGKENV